MISSHKEEALKARMRSLGILESDLEESFTRSSGPGGQHVNKSSTCVQLLHRPTGLFVKCQEDRSQAVNRYLARRRLTSLYEAKILKQKTDEEKAREKIRRQKRRRSRRAKEKMLEAKHHQSAKKALRQAPRDDWGE